LRYRPTKFEILAFLGVFIMLLIGTVKACKAETEYERFERNFLRMMVDMDWGHHSKNNRELLSVALWAGSGRSYRTASYAACIGVMETHYTRNEKGKTYDKTRGYLGTHNGTLIAEAKRIGLDGDRESLLSLWDKSPLTATWIGASRWSYILRVYKFPDVSLSQWVAGESWKKTEHGKRKAARYVRGVEKLREKYFVR